ncbi:MAG: DUF938 domain-containing protein [Rhodospirillales bacterium]
MDPDAGDKRLTSPSAERNLPPLRAALAPLLPREGLVLELASGPGAHAVAFADDFPFLDWQPSDRDPRALASIAAWRESSALTNLRAPLALDLSAAAWWEEVPEQPAAALAVNVTHISPWSASEGLLRGLGKILPQGGGVFLYGPFFEVDKPAAPSNLAFDRSLRQQNPAWGLRAVEALDALAESNALRPETRVAMPSNNLLLVYRRQASRLSATPGAASLP